MANNDLSEATLDSKSIVFMPQAADSDGRKDSLSTEIVKQARDEIRRTTSTQLTDPPRSSFVQWWLGTACDICVMLIE